MEAVFPVILILAGFYVGWNIGANDAANCIGTTVGAQIISYRKAVLLMSVCVILGGALQGHHVMKTVGKGIVISEAQEYEAYNNEAAGAEFRALFPDDRLPDKAILVALLSAGFFVTLATFSSVPVSTSQAIVGGVAGTGLGIVGFNASYFKLAVLLAFGLYLLLGRLLRQVSSVVWSKVMAVGVVLSAAYVSYSLGANDVGNAIGPLLSKYPDKGLWLALLGGVAMAVGAMMFGQRVTDTVGKSITPLDYGGALAAQLSAAFGVHLFSMAGIPVSTSQAVVGGVVGVGLTRGVAAVSGKKLSTIFVGWVVTPACAAVFAALVYRLLA